MNARGLALIYLAVASVVSLPSAAADAPWLLPNFANRLSMEVSNSGSARLQALATLPIVKARSVAPDFPGRVALAVVDEGDSGNRRALSPRRLTTWTVTARPMSSSFL